MIIVATVKVEMILEGSVMIITNAPWNVSAKIRYFSVTIDNNQPRVLSYYVMNSLSQPSISNTTEYHETV